jgi:hypothetical protein
MKSDFLTLNSYDFLKGLQMFVITAIIMSVGGVVMQAGFDVFTADWLQIGKDAVNVSVISTFSYLTKNFFSSK